jgi:hypothetical protein
MRQWVAQVQTVNEAYFQVTRFRGCPSIKHFDILDDLICQGLNGFVASPGNMRRENKVRQV